ncbi:MAG: MFS transporter [Candidatus Shapirobacteria bacterium]|jgi:MFS family permease
MKKLLLMWFPGAEREQVRWYYLTSILLDVWFVEAIWYFYWGKFGSYQSVGLVFSVLTAIWVILEIPTGLFADRFGRRKSTVLGAGIMAVGAVVVAGAQNMAWLAVGGLMENVGRAFISGAIDALVYEDIKAGGGDYDKLYGKVAAAKVRGQIAIYSLSVVTGGFLFSVYFRLAHILQAIVIAAAFLASRQLKEVETKLSSGERIDYVAGFKQLATKKMRGYLLPLLGTAILVYFYDWGLSKPNIALKFGYGYEAQGVIFGMMAVINVILLGQFGRWREKVGDYWNTYMTNFLVAGCLVMVGVVTGYIGIILVLLMELATAWGATIQTTVINRHIDSKYRATTLSTLEFVTKIPFILTTTMVGRLIDTGKIDYFHLAIGGMGLAVGLISLIIYKSNEPNKI